MIFRAAARSLGFPALCLGRFVSDFELATLQDIGKVCVSCLLAKLWLAHLKCNSGPGALGWEPTIPACLGSREKVLQFGHLESDCHLSLSIEGVRSVFSFHFLLCISSDTAALEDYRV